MKYCKLCKTEKPDHDYIKVKGYKHAYCNPCRLEYQRKYNRIKQQRKQRLW
jgi:hypothetical protein